MKHLNFILLLTLAFCLSYCKDFLDIPPQGKKTAQELLATLDKNTPIQVVNAIYNQLYTYDQHSFSWIGISSITSDDADKGSIPGDNGKDKNKLDNFTHGPNDVSVQQVYISNFKGVARSNRAIDLMPAFLKDKKFALTETVEKDLMGQARFLRAYFYWNLVRVFGAVPKLDQVGVTLRTSCTRVPADTIYKQIIIPDLQYGIKNLKSKSAQTSAEIGRPTSGAAKCFLAKVYMYRKEWAKVKQLTDDIINSAAYTIKGVPYEEIWREKGENSAESIWEIQARGKNNGTKGIQQYTDVQGYRNVFGWGFNTPSKNLINFYEPGDLRKDATIMCDGETLWDGTKITSTDKNVPRCANEKSYASKTKESYSGDLAQTNKNLRVFRYAEVLLMSAEAALHLGGDAAKPLNAVRVRAGLTPLPASKVNRAAVWRERRAELAFEHDRFFDLVRQGRAATVLGPLGFTAGKNEVFPIPQSQIELCEGLLTQNSGY